MPERKQGGESVGSPPRPRLAAYLVRAPAHGSEASAVIAPARRRLRLPRVAQAAGGVVSAPMLVIFKTARQAKSSAFPIEANAVSLGKIRGQPRQQTDGGDRHIFSSSVARAELGPKAALRLTGAG